MLTVTDGDLFFSEHPLNKCYLKFPAEQRGSAIVTAERDVAAALGKEALDDTSDSRVTAAVFEQAIFLLLNPEYLTGHSCETLKEFSYLAPRAYALVADIIKKCEASSAGTDDTENGSCDGYDDPFPLLRFCRG